MFKALSGTVYTALFFLSAIVELRGERPCNQRCTQYWNPVCGSDEVTYRNTACLSACNITNLNLQVQHKGVCCTDPGEEKFGGTCLYFSEEEDKLDYNKAKDSCKAKNGRLAIFANNPKDAASFINEKKGRVSFWVAGKYSSTTKSGYGFWVSGQHSTSSERFSRCRSSCTQYMNPVCGSDGKSYKNRDCLSAYACNHPYLDLQVQHGGVCNTEQAQSSGVECPRQNGHFKHEDPTNCDEYYECFNGTSTRRKCPDNLYFDEAAGVCDWASNALRSGCVDKVEVLPDGFSCARNQSQRKSQARVPDHKDCRSFYICYDDINSELLHCPDGEVFNEFTLLCDDPINVTGCENYYAGTTIQPAEIINVYSEEIVGEILTILQNGFGG